MDTAFYVCSMDYVLYSIQFSLCTYVHTVHIKTIHTYEFPQVYTVFYICTISYVHMYIVNFVSLMYNSYN